MKAIASKMLVEILEEKRQHIRAERVEEYRSFMSVTVKSIGLLGK